MSADGRPAVFKAVCGALLRRESQYDSHSSRRRRTFGGRHWTPEVPVIFAGSANSPRSEPTASSEPRWLMAANPPRWQAIDPLTSTRPTTRM